MPTWRNWQIRGHTHTRGPRVPTAGLLHAAHCPKNAFCHPIPTVLLSPFYRQGTQERLPHPRAHSGSMQSPNHPAKVGGKYSGVPTRLEGGRQTAQGRLPSGLCTTANRSSDSGSFEKIPVQRTGRGPAANQRAFKDDKNDFSTPKRIKTA